MQDNPARAEKRASLARLGTEFTGLSARKVEQWLDELAFASPQHVERAVDRLLKQPDRQYLPHIGEILAMVPRVEKTDLEFFWWDSLTGESGGDITRLTKKDRAKIADSLLASWTDAHRDRNSWCRAQWPRVKALIETLDPDAF